MWWPFLFPTTGDEWRAWLDDDAPKLLAIVFVILLVRIVSGRVGHWVLRNAGRSAGRIRGEDPAVTERRVRTLHGSVTWAITLFAGFIGIVTALDVMGVNIAPLLAGAGVAGIAIGLGAQTLIRDVLNGMFIMLEDQYGVGDVVRVANVSGTVVDITPRRTVLRDADGNMHTIPNSSITVATNMTRDFSRINLDVAVEYSEDLGRVFDVINEECRRLAEERPDDVLAPPKVLRVDALTADGINVKIAGDVRPAKQWDLTGELRLRLKNRFDAEGIVMAHAKPAEAPASRQPAPPASALAPPPT